jgi:predicted HAD superfamily Cof-like phosphohydrolase
LGQRANAQTLGEACGRAGYFEGDGAAADPSARIWAERRREEAKEAAAKEAPADTAEEKHEEKEELLMHKPQQQVAELHREVVNAPTSPAEPKLRNPELRARLILEEAFETAVGLVGGYRATQLIGEQCREIDPAAKPDLVEAIDGCIDTLVVVYGTLEDIGVDAEPFFDEVHRANMAKRGGPMRADGKRLKPQGWKPPNIAGLLEIVRGLEKTDWDHLSQRDYREQAISFAYGNLKIDKPDTTREQVEAMYDRIYGAK